MLNEKSLPNLIEDFIFDRKSKRLSKKTIRSYTDELRYFCKFITENYGDIEITDITSSMIKKWLVKLGESRNKGGVFCSFTVIRVLFLWAENELDLLNWHNPIKKVKLPKPHLNPLDPIPLDNIKKLIDGCHGMFALRDQCLLKFLIDGGFRANELLSVRHSDISLNGQCVIRNGKGSKRRLVFLGKNTMKTYQQYLASKENIDPEGYIFINERKLKLEYMGLYQIVGRRCKNADLPFYPPHSFRRTFGITLFRKGINLLTISLLLGHQGIEITRRYLAVTNADLENSYRSPIDGLLE